MIGTPLRADSQVCPLVFVNTADFCTCIVLLLFLTIRYVYVLAFAILLFARISFCLFPCSCYFARIECFFSCPYSAHARIVFDSCPYSYIFDRIVFPYSLNQCPD